MFTSKKNGNRIFLPAAGGGSGSSLSSAGSGGYWSGAFDDGRNAWVLSFYSSNVRTDDDDRRNGRSVRPVSD